MIKKVLDRLDLQRDISDEELLKIIDDTILNSQEMRYRSVQEKIRLKKEIYASIRGFDVLQELLEQPDINEIMVNGYENIFIERRGELRRVEKKFSSIEKLQDMIQQIVSKVNRRVNEANPIVDARLPDGSRVNIVLPPVALDGPVITIRKFPNKRIDMEKLIELGSISKELAKELEMYVRVGMNIFISGGTGSGKTTFLNALSDCIPKTERIITIEDSAELQINGIENLVRLEARQPNAEGMNEITIRDLIKTALRMRPDRVIVGEVRGAEALDMLQAMNTGHDGSLSTGHANSTRDMLSRLETMVLMGVEMPLQAIQSQIAAGIDLIIHLGRMPDRSRKILEIVEILPPINGEIQLNKLYKYDYESNCLVTTGNRLKQRDKLEKYGEVES